LFSLDIGSDHIKPVLTNDYLGLTFLTNLLKLVTTSRINRQASTSRYVTGLNADNVYLLQLKHYVVSTWRSLMISTRCLPLWKRSQCCRSCPRLMKKPVSSCIKRRSVEQTDVTEAPSKRCRERQHEGICASDPTSCLRPLRLHNSKP